MIQRNRKGIKSFAPKKNTVLQCHIPCTAQHSPSHGTSRVFFLSAAPIAKAASTSQPSARAHPKRTRLVQCPSVSSTCTPHDVILPQRARLFSSSPPRAKMQGEQESGRRSSTDLLRRVGRRKRCCKRPAGKQSSSLPLLCRTEKAGGSVTSRFPATKIYLCS